MPSEANAANATATDSATPVEAGLDLGDGIAATVDGVEILESDVIARVDMMIGTQIPIASVPPEQLEPIRASVRPQALEEMIAESLLDAEVERVGIEVEDSEYLAEIEKTVASYLSSQDMTREAFAERISQDTGQDLDAFLTERAADPTYRRLTRHSRLISNLYPEQTEVTDEEIAARFETAVEQMTRPAQVRASHVLIGSEPEKPMEEREADRQQAEEIAMLAQEEGADFAALAQEHSSCPSSAQGGDLGMFPRQGSMVEPFAAAAFDLQVGETSGVVETQFGFHVIRVTERQEEFRPELDDVAGMLRDSIRLEKVAEARASHLETLQANAKIERAGS